MWRLTQEDIINLNKYAIERVADALNLDTEGKSWLAVFSEISDTNDPLFNLLDSFIANYRQYQNQINHMDFKAFEGQEIVQEDRDELTRRIGRRNESRSALIEALNNR